MNTEEIVENNTHRSGHLKICRYVTSEFNADCTCGYEDFLADVASDLAEENSTDENHEEQTVEKQEENNE
jgi:hypothetical protein